MNVEWMAIRTVLSKIGITLLLVDVVLYIVGNIHLQTMIGAQKPLQLTLEMGSRYFFAGGLIALLSIPFLLFARGWKRVPLVAGSLILVPLFVGFTLY